MCQSREQLIRETRVLFRELIIENKVYGRLYAQLDLAVARKAHAQTGSTQK